MSDYVWVSNMQADPELILPFEADLAVNDPELAAEASRSLKAGRPLSDDMFAREIWASEGAGTVRNLPNLFYANGHSSPLMRPRRKVRTSGSTPPCPRLCS